MAGRARLLPIFKHGVFWFPKVPHLDLRRWVNAGLALFKRYVKEQGMPDLLHVHSLLHAGPWHWRFIVNMAFLIVSPNTVLYMAEVW